MENQFNFNDLFLLKLFSAKKKYKRESFFHLVPT